MESSKPLKRYSELANASRKSNGFPSEGEELKRGEGLKLEEVAFDSLVGLHLEVL